MTQPDRKTHVPQPVPFKLISQPAVPRDTAEAGTSEAAWLQSLAVRPSWNPCINALVVVSPHPHDETLGAGGLIRASALRGIPVRVISVTDGENARPNESERHRLRRRELREAMECLGTHDNPIDIVRLHLPDGAVTDYVPLLRNAIINLCTPGTWLVGPFEHDGHVDHDATAGACIGAAKRMKLTLARYPIRAWRHRSRESMQRLNLVRFELDSGLQRCKARAVNCFTSRFGADPPGTHFARPLETFVLSNSRR